MNPLEKKKVENIQCLRRIVIKIISYNVISKKDFIANNQNLFFTEKLLRNNQTIRFLKAIASNDRTPI